MVTLTGRIKHETPKAVLFAVSGNGDPDHNLGLAEVWVPKSQATVLPRAMGPKDQVDIPEWLYDSRVSEQTEVQQ